MSAAAVPALRCFDLDGCVIVSDEAITDGIRHALRTIDLPMIDPARVRSVIGPPLVSTFADLVQEAGTDPTAGEGLELVRAAVTAYRARYEEVGFDLTRPVDGIVALLERVNSVGFGRTIIVTAKPTAVAEPLLEHIGLDGAFEAVYGAPLGHAVEEKTVTLARALESTGTAARDAIMIGDRSHDVRAGRSCGTRTVGVLWGAGDRSELEQAGADLVVVRPDELDGVLISSGSSAGR